MRGNVVPTRQRAKTQLQMVERRVAEGRRRVERQRQIAQEMERPRKQRRALSLFSGRTAAAQACASTGPLLPARLPSGRRGEAERSCG